MNVYFITGSGEYAAGCMVVAAPSGEEAREVACKEAQDAIRFEKGWGEVILLPVEYAGPVKVLAEFSYEA